MFMASHDAGRSASVRIGSVNEFVCLDVVRELLVIGFPFREAEACVVVPDGLAGHSVAVLRGLFGLRGWAHVCEAFEIGAIFDREGRGMHVADLYGGLEQLHFVDRGHGALNLPAAE